MSRRKPAPLLLTSGPPNSTSQKAQRTDTTPEGLFSTLVYYKLPGGESRIIGHIIHADPYRGTLTCCPQRVFKHHNPTWVEMEMRRVYRDFIASEEIARHVQKRCS